MRTTGLIARGLDHLGALIVAHPWRWIAGWLVVLGLALPLALNAPQHLSGANGGVHNSEAQQVEALIKSRFDFPFAESYQVVIHHPNHRVSDPSFRKAVGQLEQILKQQPDTRALESWYHRPDPLWLSADQHSTFLWVGQAVAPAEVLERRVGEIRAALMPTLQKLRQQGFEVFQTGMNPVIYDVGLVTASSTATAEKDVFIFTFALLLLAFGSLGGALLPLVIAAGAMVLGLAWIGILARIMPVAVYAQSISSMIALAVGIDYALLFVWRYREERLHHPEQAAAIRATVLHAGAAILFAGLTFMIGLGGLMFAGITSLFSIGLGGALVVGISVLLSLTLLPALLVIATPLLDFPKPWARHLQRLRPSRFWEPLVYHILKRPYRTATLGLLVLLSLSWPATRLEINELDLTDLPATLESRQGFEVLKTMQVSGLMTPALLIIEAEESLLQPQHLTNLRAFHQRLAAHPRIAQVTSIAGIRTDLEAESFFSQLPMLRLLFPEPFRLLLSPDDQLTLIQVIPKDLQDYDQLVKLCAQWRAEEAPRLAQVGLKLYVGGPPGLTLDYNLATFKPLPGIIVGVLFATFGVLFWALRSYLVALKAVTLNLLSVGVSYGVVVMVFQWGWLPGVRPTAIMAYVPLLLFCIIFGLSIDYEVFLMSRIREEHLQGASDAEATARGIRATGDVITYAAAIMCLVFAAFTRVEVSIIRQLGFGLATAIVVDATLIRMILVPAFMQLAGRWNWYPGTRR
jgi:RND superfamily putative drug exporter